MPHPLILEKRYGKLTVFTDQRRNGYVRTVCDCGNERWVIPRQLAIGNTKSCKACIPYGEHVRKRDPKTKRPEYLVWAEMLRRCHYPKHKGFPNYGGRGISVCERWHTFENFFADMGPRPGGKREYSIERVDNDGNYEPGNCEWLPFGHQSRNRRSLVSVVYRGDATTLYAIGSERGWDANERELRGDRIRRGWSAEDAIDIPLGIRRNRYHGARG